MSQHMLFLPRLCIFIFSLFPSTKGKINASDVQLCVCMCMHVLTSVCLHVHVCVLKHVCECICVDMFIYFPFLCLSAP